MAVNPEFQRNVWQEMSGHRVVAMPLILGVIFFFIYLLSDFSSEHSVAIAAQLAFLAITLFWGAKQAGDAIAVEIQNRTWDWQRMSSIAPWTMAWGKLLGSTVYVWYGGIMCLAVYGVFAVGERGVTVVGKMIVLLAASALTVQAWTLLFSLLLIRQRPGSYRKGSAGLILLAFLLIFAVPSLFGDGRVGGVVWYGQRVALLDFAVVSMLVFLAWSVVGVYRLVRTELQFRSRPWVWLGFILFLMAYAGGFPYADAVDRRLVAYSIALSATLLMVLLEPKDPVAWRALTRAVAAGAWPRAMELTPRWTLTLGLSAGLAISLVVTPPAFSVWLPTRLANSSVPILATLLLLMRDVGIVLWLSLGERVKRPEFTAVIYILLLYSVLPATLAGLGLEAWTTAFWPRPDVSMAAGVGPALVEVIVISTLVYRRWLAHFSRVPDRA